MCDSSKGSSMRTPDLVQNPACSSPMASGRPRRIDTACVCAGHSIRKGKTLRIYARQGFLGGLRGKGEMFSHTKCSHTICVKEKTAEKVFSNPPCQRLASPDGRGCVRAKGAIPLPRIGRRSGRLLTQTMLGALGLRCRIRDTARTNANWAAVGHGLQVCDFAFALQ